MFINFYVSTENTDLLSNSDSFDYYNYEFEFEILFPESIFIKNLAIENSFSYKQVFNTDLTSQSKNIINGKTFYYGLLIHESQCNRLYKDCFKNNDDKMYACIIASPQYPGIYTKNLKCLFYLRKTLKNETFIIINSYTQIDSKICLNKNLKKNQYKSYICENSLRIGDTCKDFISIYNGSSTSNALLAEKICGNGYLPKIITKLDSFILSFNSNSDGLFANLGFIYYVLNEKQYFNNYQYFNSQIFNSDISNVDELKSIQKIEKLQFEFCDSFKSSCSIDLSFETELSGYLFSLSQYHIKNFTLKYKLKTNLNAIGVFIENYYISKCDESYLSIAIKHNQVEKICHETHPEYSINKKLYLINNQISNEIIITQYKLNQVFDSQKRYDFKIYYEYFHLNWDTHVKSSVCNYIIKPNSMNKGSIVNPQFDIIYKFNSLNCKYQLIGNRNQYIKLTVNEITFNNDNCNENLFQIGQDDYDLENKCSQIDTNLMIKEPDPHFTSMLKNDGSNNKTIAKACMCKRVDEKKVFISQTNFIELSYNLKIKQFRGWNHRQNKFNITYEFIHRNCVIDQTDELKGVIEYDSEQKNGVQKEFFNQTYLLLHNDNRINQNFNCRFNINAPKDSLIYIEFIDLDITSKNCDFNYIKIYSKPKTVALKLCNMMSSIVASEQKNEISEIKRKQVLNVKNILINGEFLNENMIDKILTCYYNAKKLCFVSSDLISNSKTNEIDNLNKISIEIFVSVLTDFKLKIRYHYFTLSNQTKDNNNHNNQECGFKCSSKIHLFNETEPSNICLNKKFLCDSNIDCVYSEDDESDCKFKKKF